MKKIIYVSFFISICFVLLLPLNGCKKSEISNLSSEVAMYNYYQKEDFKSIIIGKSTYKDVYNIAPTETMQITSYGGVCEYETQTGGCIRIEFYGKELVVGNIKEIKGQSGDGSLS